MQKEAFATFEIISTGFSDGDSLPREKQVKFSGSAIPLIFVDGYALCPSSGSPTVIGTAKLEAAKGYSKITHDGSIDDGEEKSIRIKLKGNLCRF